jgi:hypothetical protein
MTFSISVILHFIGFILIIINYITSFYPNLLKIVFSLSTGITILNYIFIFFEAISDPYVLFIAIIILLAFLPNYILNYLVFKHVPTLIYLGFVSIDSIKMNNTYLPKEIIDRIKNLSDRVLELEKEIRHLKEKLKNKSN